VINGRLQVGVIGTGGISRDQHLPAWAKVSFADVVALADVSKEALEKASALIPATRAFHDWKDLVACAEIDIVDICTPNATHAPIALSALHQGKHVLCEKPLATTAAEVRAMRDAAQASGKLLMAAQHLRFEPAGRQLKAFIDAGTLGDIYYARAQWLRRRLLPPRATFIERQLSGGGAALDIGVHILDLAYWFMGAPEPVAVSAVVGTQLAQREDLTGSWGDWDRARLDVEDFAAAFIRFAGGKALTLEATWLGFQPENENVRLQCYGDRAGLVWPDGVVCGETNRAPWEMRLKDLTKQAGHAEEILEFATAVYKGLPSPVPPEDSLNVARILDAIYRSGRESREVAIQ
jgi:predicted dehydrogenase